MFQFNLNKQIFMIVILLQQTPLRAEENDLFLHSDSFQSNVIPLLTDAPITGKHYWASTEGVFTVNFNLENFEDEEDVKYFKPSTTYKSDVELFSFIGSHFMGHMKERFIENLIQSGELNIESLTEDLKVELKVPDIEPVQFYIKHPNNTTGFILEIMHEITSPIPAELLPAPSFDDLFSEIASWAINTIDYTARERIRQAELTVIKASADEAMSSMYI